MGWEGTCLVIPCYNEIKVVCSKFLELLPIINILCRPSIVSAPPAICPTAHSDNL